jgi:PAS domain-containing protein
MPSNEVSMPMWHEKHLRAATQAAGVALWSWNVDTDAITMDERAYDLWEVSKEEKQITFEILSRNIHPADLERVRSALPRRVPSSAPTKLTSGYCRAAISAGSPRGAKATTLT